MPSNSIKHKKYGFTLAEMLMVCSIFAIMIAGLIVGINRAYVFMNNTKLQTIATNLAREGMEMMYNIRDTNRRKYSGEKDSNWLSGSSFSRIDTASYLIIGTGTSGDSYIYGTSRYCGPRGCYDWDLSECYDEKSFFSPLDGDLCEEVRNRARISFSGEYKYLSGTNIVTGDMQSLLGDNIEFYRVVRVFGTYKKDANNSNTHGVYKDPVELRFCVKVFYRNNGTPHSTELCSVMTNFAK